MPFNMNWKKPKAAGVLVSSLDNPLLWGVKQTMLVLLALVVFMATAQAAESSAAEKSVAEKSPVKVLAFGDSLTAGYGLKREEALPVQLQALFDAAGVPVQFVQGGVSGDTTASGLNRLEWTIKRQQPQYAILALGGNDMLRAIDPATTHNNLRRMLDIFKAHNIPVLLAGMRAPSSYGAAFAQGYDNMYKSLAAEYGAVLYPFLLEGVAQDPRLNLRDGVHPNADGVQVIARGIYPSVVELLKKK